jgi:hypothetical protein
VNASELVKPANAAYCISGNAATSLGMIHTQPSSLATAWPDIKKLALVKLAQSAENRAGISHVAIKRRFGISEEDIERIPEMCWEDEHNQQLSCHNFMNDLCFVKRSA